MVRSLNTMTGWYSGSFESGEQKGVEGEDPEGEEKVFGHSGGDGGSGKAGKGCFQKQGKSKAGGKSESLTWQGEIAGLETDTGLFNIVACGEAEAGAGRLAAVGGISGFQGAVRIEKEGIGACGEGKDAEYQGSQGRTGAV